MTQNKFKQSLFWKIILRIYGVYALILFVVTFGFVFPICVFAGVVNRPTIALRVNHYWAHIFFFLVGMPMDIQGKETIDKRKNYIFCPNHFSFLDIAILPFVPVPFMFIGKLSIANVPLFGYMFRKFHITIDRSNMRDKYSSYKRGLDALTNGGSLAIFPEGGIKSISPPELNQFKEGPFRMSIESGVALVPITMADNWHIFPDDGKFYLHRRRCRMVIHHPIDPKKYTMDQLKEFQNDVHDLIQQELNTLNLRPIQSVN